MTWGSSTLSSRENTTPSRVLLNLPAYDPFLGFSDSLSYLAKIMKMISHSTGRVEAKQPDVFSRDLN